MLVLSSAGRHGGAGSTPSPSAAPRGREMLVPCIPAPPVPTSALGSQQKGMFVPCISPPFPLGTQGEGMRIPGALPPSPRSALGTRGRGMLVHVHPPRFSPCCVWIQKERGRTAPLSPSSALGTRGGEGAIPPSTHTQFFFCSALGTQEVASPTLPSFRVAAR